MSAADLSTTKALATVFSRRSGAENFGYLLALLTEKELVLIENRLRIGLRLQEGVSYLSIQKELHVSAATVALVAKDLENPEYASLLTHLHKEFQKFRRWRVVS